jgi:hypothetical protein
MAHPEAVEIDAGELDMVIAARGNDTLYRVSDRSII